MNASTNIQPVILSGGSGSRLWPKSRTNYPKQFLSVNEIGSLLQNTAKRFQLPNVTPPMVIANARHRFIIAEQMQQIDRTPATLILEPEGRNTAAAIAIAALHCKDPNTVLVILPSDHLIEQLAKFQLAVHDAAQIAASGKIVTFGITPTSPHTGYGYIQAGEKCNNRANDIISFTEKPDADTAQQYLDSGNYYWNSGMFITTAETALRELSKWQPEIIKHCQTALQLSVSDQDFVRLDEASFCRCPSLPFDTAVMEHCQNAAVIPVDFPWSDIGSWEAIWQISEKDTQGNATQGNVVLNETENCLVDSCHGVVAASHVNDLIIINTEDAVLIAPKTHSEEVKTLVEKMKQSGLSQAHNLVRHYRPWGHYQTIAIGDNYQVKRLCVKPGKRLSLQYHHHRAEHWVVVSGTAKVTNGEDEKFLGPNQSTYIPIGNTHRLENPGNMMLDIIEVQSGQYLGEDDIVRIEDDFQRQLETALDPKATLQEI